MGWGLSMAVVEALSAEEIAARLDMDLTEERVVYYTGALHMVGLHRDGRGVVVTDTAADVMPLEDERLLARLSRDAKVVVLEVIEAIDVRTWRISHCPDEPETENLGVVGNPPAVFAAIAKRYRAKQAEADALGEDIHYYGRIVIETFVSLTGIEFNGSGWWETIEYRALKPGERSSPTESVKLGETGRSGNC